ncbi:glycosyltransferase [Shewanella mesophila]|uniref:glycosyltransferase n=1 Tax=Shewanella mesophila TaxID=2864208 RepID=UPI001C65FB48|nr:glycosyltransferase [Shewanella mesophila]QYJ85009.1 glycosyltransferase [Shewanella mesophila]
MKVIYFLSEFPCYSETFIINQINGLIERGIDIQIITLKQGEAKDIEIIKRHDLISRTTCLTDVSDGSINKRYVQLKNILFSLTNSNFRKIMMRKLKDKNFGFVNYANLIKKRSHFEADAIVAHFGPSAIIADDLIELGCLSGKLYPVFHGYDISHKNVLKKYLPAYQRLFKKEIIALPISELWRQKLLEFGCPAEKILVNRMGIDADCFTFNPQVKLHSPLQLLTVARHSEKKGLEYSIRAMKLLQAANIDFQYNIIGTGPLFDNHLQLIRELGLKNSVTLLGYQDPNAINQHLENTDVFILPSVTAESGDMEGIPVALMEAMAKGVICLSTLHSGIPELIENNHSGYLVPERDPNALATILTEIVNGKHNLAQIKATALQTILDIYNQKHIYDQLADLLRNNTK